MIPSVDTTENKQASITAVFVFTGQVRNKLNFEIELKKVKVLLDEGVISHVYWAAWESELSQAPEYLLHAVSSGWLTFKATTGLTTNESDPSSAFQRAHLETALNGLEGKEWVLKSRPDVILPLARMRAFLDPKHRRATTSYIHRHWGIENRLIMNWFNPAQLFTFCDLTFAGMAHDLIHVFQSGDPKYSSCSHNACRHFGNLAFPAFSQETRHWYEWLETYYPGRVAITAADSSGRLRAYLYRMLARIFFEWPECHWDHVWRCVPDSKGLSLGWCLYFEFVRGGIETPMRPDVSRVGFADRTYCADGWQLISSVEMLPNTRPPHGVAICEAACHRGKEADDQALDLVCNDLGKLAHIFERDRSIIRNTQLRLLADLAWSLARVKLGSMRKTAFALSDRKLSRQ